MKKRIVELFAQSLEKIDGFTRFIRWFFTIISLPFIFVFSGLFAALTETGRIFSQGPFRAIATVLIFPAIFITRLTNDARKDLLWCLPAIIAGMLITGVAILSFAQGDRIQQRYRAKAVNSIRQGDFDRASVFCQRVVYSKGEVLDSDRLRWAMCLLETGQDELGKQVIDDLAPDGKQGYPPAHRIKALNLAMAVEQSNNPALSESLRFHLEHAEDNTSEAIQTAYAVYYLATDQVTRAVNYLKIAAQKNPLHYHTIASIYSERDEDAPSLEALRNAEDAYRELVKQNPSSQLDRIALAKTFSRLENYEDAEKCLLEGLAINDTPLIRRSLSEYCLMRHNLTEDFDEQLGYLQKSIDFDINFLPAYQALVRQFKFHLQESPEQAEQLESLLRDNLASGKNTALAHFAMSGVKSKKGDKKMARFHSEKAYELEPRFAVLANNLAWFLVSDEENIDLERAYELASEIVLRNPKHPQMLDTYATVLMKQEKYDEALIHFEKALATIQNKKNVHTKLAFVYEKLGMDDMKEVHLRKAAQIETPK